MAHESFFAVGAALMWIGTLAFVWLRSVDDANRGFHTAVTLVGTIAALAYTSMTLGIGALAVDGGTIYVGRYVQWITATPLIVLYLGLLAGADDSTILALMAVDVLAMVAAFGAALTAGTTRWAAFAVGSVLYVVLIYALLQLLGRAAADQPAGVGALFRKLRNLTVVSWSFYPLVWALGPLGVGILDPVAEVLLVTYLDVIAKVVFGLIAFNSQMALDRMPELDALRAWRDAAA